MKNIQIVTNPAKSYTDYVIMFNKIKGTNKGVLSLLTFCNKINAGKSITITDKSKEIYKLNKTLKPITITFEKELVYTSDGKYSVYAGDIQIARSYVALPNSNRNFDVKILQGMDRTETIKKIIKDCPAFAKENEIDENYYPNLFSR